MAIEGGKYEKLTSERVATKREKTTKLHKKKRLWPMAAAEEEDDDPGMLPKRPLYIHKPEAISCITWWYCSYHICGASGVFLTL